MALTKVSGDVLDSGISVAGVVTATAFDGPFRGGSDSDIIAGIGTFTRIDINGDADIDGQTELDDLNVAGVSTFAGALDVNSNVDISGFIDVDGQTTLDDLNVSGVSTFASNLDINNNVDVSGFIDVDGQATLDDLNVSGVSTFASNLDVNNNVDISGFIDVDGQTTLDDLNVSGISTLAQLKMGSVTATSILDEDNMASNSATSLATQQSIKAYVDTQVTAQDLDVTSDSGTIAIDLDSETLSISGTANEIETSATGNALTVGLPNNVTVSGNLTVGGVLQYEDVVNIDSVGIVTARSDIHIGDKIVHIGDTNTAIRFLSSGDTITAETSGSERFRIDPNGNITQGVLGNATFSSVNSISANTARGIEIFKGGTDTGSAIKLAGDNGSGTKAWSQIGYSGADGTAHWANYNTSGTLQSQIVIGATGKVGVNTTTNLNAGAMTLYSANEGEGTATGQLELKDNAAFGSTPTGGIIFSGHHTTGSQAIFAGIRGFKANTGDGDLDGCLAFDVRKHGAVAYEAMRIDEDGKVLIGLTASTSSDANLQSFKPSGNNSTIVVGNVATSASGLCRLDFCPSNSVVGARIECHASEDFSTVLKRTADLVFITRQDGGSSEKVRILSSGEVGIGVDDPAKTGIQNGVKVLQIDGGDGAELILGNSTSSNVSTNHIGAIAFKNIDSSTGSAPHYAGIRCNCTDTSGNMNLKFYAGGGGGTGFEDDTPDMLIDSVGRVGIGTEDPGSPLEVSGGTAIDTATFNSHHANGVLINLQRSGTSKGFLGSGKNIADASGGVDDIGLRSNANLILTAGGGTERARITSSGALLVGLTSPTYNSGDMQHEIKKDNSRTYTAPLMVGHSHLFLNNSDTTTNAFCGLGIRAGSGDGAIGYVYTGSANSADFVINTDGGSNGVERFRITNDGKILIGTTTGSSDPWGYGAHFQLNGDSSGAESTLSLARHSADTGAPVIVFGKSRATGQADVTVVQDGDTLGSIHFTGADGSNWEPAASIMAYVDGTPASSGDGTDMPGRLCFYTTPDGSDSVSERMRIHHSGEVTIPGGVTLGVSADSKVASNTLDDYETGTFTMSVNLVNESYTANTFYYVKMGRLVTWTGRLHWTGGNGTSDQILGLPFTVRNLDYTNSMTTNIYSNSGLDVGSDDYLCAYHAQGNTRLNMTKQTTTSTYNLPGDANVYMTGFYYTDS